MEFGMMLHLLIRIFEYQKRNENNTKNFRNYKKTTMVQ